MCDRSLRPLRARFAAPGWILLLLVPGLVAPVGPSVAWGGPHQGLGLSGGVVHHDYRLGQDVGGPLVFTGTGVGVLAEAQFVGDPPWTLAPILQFSLERSTDMFDLPEPTRGRVLAFAGTLQFRRWRGDYFVGGHAGIYSAFFRSYSGQVFRHHSPGLGFAMGWESDAGRTALVAFDYDNPVREGSRLLSVRLHFGYRWW